MKYSVGDRLECISDFTSLIGFSKGKTYSITNIVMYHGVLRYYICNDCGSTDTYIASDQLEDCFQLADDKNAFDKNAFDYASTVLW